MDESTAAYEVRAPEILHEADHPTVEFRGINLRHFAEALKAREMLGKIESIGEYLVHGDDTKNIIKGTTGWVLPGLRPDGGRAMIKLSKVPAALSVGHYGDAFRVQSEAHARTPFVPLPFGSGQTLVSYVDEQGIDQKDYFPYLAMEYIEGQELHDHIQANDLDDETKLQIILTVAHGVDRMLPLISTDLKPENILIRRGNHRPIIIDLESAVDEQTNRNGNEVIGTPRYMAPEQIAAGKRVKRTLNVYQLGAIAYEMLTGEIYMNVEEGRDSQETFLKNIAPTLTDPKKNKDFLRDRLHNPRLPRRARTVLARALAQNPEERYQSATEFAIALRRSMRGKERSRYTRPSIKAQR